ncbi:MAG: DUF883 family protein [Pseudomonadota bacterium]|nr:DUF883 family protein [Pseudomonadota bacterium]
MAHVTTEKLIDELRKVVHDAEDLLRATAGATGDTAAQARARAQASLGAARERLAEFGQQAADRVREAGAHADDYVRSNPWPAIGVGALAGLVVGILLARRGGSR